MAKRIPHEIVLLLSEAGYVAYLSDYSEVGETLLGQVDPTRLEDLILKLKADPRFANGVFYGHHRDIGDDLLDFRSYEDTLAHDSVQIVLDKKTGRFYADIDDDNPYQDVESFVRHGYVVVRNFFGRLFGKGR